MKNKIVGIRMKILCCLKYLTDHKIVFKDAELLSIGLKVIRKDIKNFRIFILFF